MSENIETEIRMALDSKAHEVDVPETLAARTLETAKADPKLALRERMRSWLDARRTRLPASGYPRWMYVAGAGATAVLLFVVGAFVTMPSGTDNVASGPPVAVGYNLKTLEAEAQSAPGRRVVRDEDVDRSTGNTDSGDAVGGQVVGVVGGSAGSVGAPEIAPVPPAPGTGKLPPKIARNADIQVEVKSFDPAWRNANAIASRHGGFVTNSSTEQVKDRLGRGTIAMRVPATKLDRALADLRKLGTLVQMNTSGDDISAPIADVKARLRSLNAEELQLLELLGRADSVSETLEVRTRLDDVRQQVESLKAQRDVYESQVDYATINASIFEKGVDPDNGGDDGIIGNAFRTALRIGLTIVAGTVVVLGGLLPLALLGIAIWLIVRTIRRRRTV